MGCMIPGVRVRRDGEGMVGGVEVYGGGNRVGAR